MSDGEDEEQKMNCDSLRSDEEDDSNSDDDVVRRPKKARKPVADSSESETDLEDLDLEDVDKVMRLLPDSPTGLLDFANAVQGILLLLVLKQHLKNQYGFSDRYFYTAILTNTHEVFSVDYFNQFRPSAAPVIP